MPIKGVNMEPTLEELKELAEEFPEGIPSWMFQHEYSATKIRTLMKSRRMELKWNRS